MMTDGPTDPPADLTRRRHWLALAVILCLAAALRIHGLAANSFWIDEFYSLEASAGNYHAAFSLPHDQILDPPPCPTHLATAPPASHVWASLRDETHPPLYYLVLRLWRDTFGSSDAAVRSLSVIASLAILPALFDLARLLLGPTPALWACLILALSQSQIWYAQEARSYALLSATLVAAAAAVVRIETLGFTPRRGVALAAFLLAAMLTHYFALAGCGAIGGYVICRLRGRPRRHTLAAIATAAAIYALIWGPFFLQQTYRLHAWSDWLTDAQPDFLARWTHHLLDAPYRVIFGPVGHQLDATPIPKVQWIILLLPAILPARRRAMLLPFLCATTILALPAGLDLLHHTRMLEFDRYFIAAAPFACLLAASLPPIGRLRFLPHVLPAAMTLLVITSLPWVYLPHNLDWRYLGTAVHNRVRPNDVIIYHTTGPNAWYPAVFYLAVDHYAPDTGARALFLDAPAAPDLLATLRAAPHVWFLSESQGDDLPTILPGFTPGRSDYAFGVGFLTELRAPTPEVPHGR